MTKLTRRIVIVTTGVSLSMMFGMLVGVWANANFAENFHFNSVRGYEAGGHIGLLGGVFVWLLLGAYYWVKGNNNNRKTG